MKKEITGNDAGLLTLLKSRQFICFDIYTITLANGAGTLRFCGGDTDVVFNGNTYSAGGQVGPYWDRKENKARAHWKAGTDVDTLVIDCLPGNYQVFGVGLRQAIRYGVFDGAEFELDRTFAAISAGGIVLPWYGYIIFVGRVGAVDVGRSVINWTINSHLELLNQLMPRDIVQAGCINTLYDVNCTLARTSFQATGTVSGSGSSNDQINTTLVTTLTLPLGTIKFTSGNNSGLSATIKSYTSGSLITTMMPFPSAPQAGDAFTVNAGCDKQQNTCANVFDNIANYRGFPYVPIPETAV